MDRQTIAVLGLGTFGQSLCRALKQGATDVIAVDRHEANVESIKDIVDVAMTGDATDPAVLQAAGIHFVDACEDRGPGVCGTP